MTKSLVKPDPETVALLVDQCEFAVTDCEQKQRAAQAAVEYKQVIFRDTLNAGVRPRDIAARVDLSESRVYRIANGNQNAKPKGSIDD